ncbi:MAG: galactokinase [Chloroflexota bacterium]
MAAEFARCFGKTPSLWGRAPGRVDLMGSHTDYNQGYVLTLSIDCDTWIAAHPRDDRQVTVYSLNVEGGGAFSLDSIEPNQTTPWTNYVRGVAAALQAAGLALSGFDGLIHSTIPFGSGLSSSAALEVATAIIFKMLGGWELEPRQLALLCRRAENQFVGVNCGILDQYTSALGEEGCALLLDCRHLTSRPAPLADGIRVVIGDTRAAQILTGPEYASRQAQCEVGAARLARFYPEVMALRDVSLAQFTRYEGDLPPVVARRCRFIIEENRRVLDLAEALSTADLGRIKSLTADSYAGARDLYEIGSPEMAAMIEAMRSAPGVIGARQTGAGFGGCMVAFVAGDLVDKFAQHVQEAYAKRTGLQPKVYLVQAAPGAGPLQFSLTHNLAVES